MTYLKRGLAVALISGGAFASSTSADAFYVSYAASTSTCQKTFTLKMMERALDTVYAGTHTPHKGAYGNLHRYARCQRSPDASRRAAVLWKTAIHAWGLRRHPPLPYGQWAIPGPIVMCESHGQNLAPNSAGASGYYQIIPSTWQSYGGSEYASEAYLSAKSGQDAVATRIWAGGSGASQWVCAGLTGY